MKRRYGALLGTCLALSLAGFAIPGMAAQPDCVAHPMEGVATQPLTLAAPVQPERLIAEVNAMFRRMDAEMNALQAQKSASMAMPLPTPQQLVAASFGPGGWTTTGPGQGIVVTEVSNGAGTCSQTITYSYPARGSQPIVHVAQSGNACGAVHIGRPGTVPAAQPIAPRVEPRPASHTAPPRLIEADYRAKEPRG
jgi:hypothetical protein